MKKKTGSELRKKTFLIVFLFSSLFSRKHLNKVFFKNFLKNIFFFCQLLLQRTLRSSSTDEQLMVEMEDLRETCATLKREVRQVEAMVHQGKRAAAAAAFLKKLITFE